MEKKSEKRIESLDWLRGLAALLIMIYHLYSWEIVPLNVDSWLGRCGIYAVSIFFLLSGLSMSIVYNNFIKDIQSSCEFFVRRIFRIWPLLFIVTTYNFVLICRNGFEWEMITVYILNITTLFGFIKPEAYISTGGWSIGNEVVYYAMTPIILLLYNKKRVYGNILFMITLYIGYYFAFNVLDKNLILSQQWITYINPFNNLYFYVGGIAIYYNFKDYYIDKDLNNVFLFISIALFCTIPLRGDLIVITTSIWRIIYSILCFIIVISFYKLKIVVPEIIGKPFELFGIATYGVYLLHPIVYLRFNYIYSNFNMLEKIFKIGEIKILCISIITIAIALISYYKFEVKIIKYGKVFLASRNSKCI